MPDYEQFSTLGELNNYLNNNFEIGITRKSDVENFLNTKNQMYEAFAYFSPKNREVKHLINSTQDYDFVIQFSGRVKQKYWLIFSTVLICVVRFHFKNHILVEILRLNIEESPL